MDRVSGLEALSKALEEGNDDFLRRVLLMGLQAVMESDVTGLCQERATESERQGGRTSGTVTRSGSSSPT